MVMFSAPANGTVCFILNTKPAAVSLKPFMLPQKQKSFQEQHVLYALNAAFMLIEIMIYLYKRKLFLIIKFIKYVIMMIMNI